MPQQNQYNSKMIDSLGESTEGAKLIRVLCAFKARILDPVTLAVTTAGALICAIAGPFDTYSADPFLFRLFFWSIIAFTSSFAGCLASIWVTIQFPDSSFLLRSIIGTTVFSLPYSTCSWWFAAAIYSRESLPHYATVFILTVAVSLTIYFGIWLLGLSIDQRVAEQTLPPQVTPDEAEIPVIQRQPPPRDPEHLKHGNTPCPFLKRLGPNGGNSLIRLAMSDHYIEVYTDTGMHLLYMRFGDAIQELRSQNGAKVHRSHWVRFSEIKQVVKDGQKITLEMSDGAMVPVSRSRRKALQDLGII